MTYQKVDESNPNLLLNVDRAAAAEPEAARQSHYVVSVPRDQPNLFSQVEELVDQQSKLYERESAELARIYFDRHLYQPLLIEGSNPAVTVSPPPLNNSEAIFVKQLRRFWRERGQDLYPETELFLLRNQGRGRGVGFFVEEAGFYPDFILWMIAGDHQRIVFVEPHGMISAKAYNEDEKAKLHEWLRDLTADLALRSRLSVRVTLDSFIVSATDYGDLRPRYGDGSWSEADFAAKHILFPDEEGRYLEAMLSAK